MQLIEGLVSYLEAAKTTAGTRIYPRRLPQEATLPALTYQIVDDPKEHTLSAPSKLGTPRIQINCWATSYLAAHALEREVEAAVNGYRGSMGGIEVYASLSENSNEDDDPETGRFWVSHDVIIWHQKP